MAPNTADALNNKKPIAAAHQDNFDSDEPESNAQAINI